MGLRHCTELAAAEWIANTTAPAEQTICFGPDVFPSYVRLRYLPDPAYPGQPETEAESPLPRQPPIALARHVLRVLSGFTSTPGSCYFGIWETGPGFGLRAEHLRGPLLDLRIREFGLFEGPLAEITDWEGSWGGGPFGAPPALVWPADQRWCFASDVDPHWAGIGGSERAIQALLNEQELDIVRAKPGAAVARYS